MSSGRVPGSAALRRRAAPAPFWLILALLWFGPLNTPHLFEPDEGRYAEIPREMVVSGDWVTPRLDDIKYFEKPALQYWATAIALRAVRAARLDGAALAGVVRLSRACC